MEPCVPPPMRHGCLSLRNYRLTDTNKKIATEKSNIGYYIFPCRSFCCTCVFSVARLTRTWSRFHQEITPPAVRKPALPPLMNLSTPASYRRNTCSLFVQYMHTSFALRTVTGVWTQEPGGSNKDSRGYRREEYVAKSSELSLAATKKISIMSSYAEIYNVFLGVQARVWKKRW